MPLVRDLEETQEAYSVSEWWLDPNTEGPPTHAHPEDHVYYVITGVVSVLLAGEWSEASTGSYILIPGGTEHSFENRGDVEAGFISFNSPGGFERDARPIAAWFEQNQLGDAKG